MIAGLYRAGTEGAGWSWAQRSCPIYRLPPTAGSICREQPLFRKQSGGLQLFTAPHGDACHRTIARGG